MSYNLIPCIKAIQQQFTKNPDCNKDSLTQGCILGEGGFGTVCYINPKQCNPPINNLEPFALKYMNFSKHINPDYNDAQINYVENYLKEILKEEVNFLNELKDVVNVLKIYPINTTSKDKEYIYMFNKQEYCIATQYLNGNDLFDYRIENSKNFLDYTTDPKFKNELDYIAQQLILTLKEIHDKNILHLDIKLENIMLDDSTIPPRPVFIDLGMAKKGLIHNEPQYSGTPGYTLSHAHTKTTRFNDIYALGRTLGEIYFFMVYSDVNGWIDDKFKLPIIINDLDYTTFFDSFINEQEPLETIKKYDELVEQIKVEPIESRPNPTPVVDHRGMVSTVRNPVIDPEIDVFNNLQLEAYVRLKKSNIYDFTHLIHSIRDIKGKLKKLFNLKSTWYHRKTKLEKYPGINKLVHVDSSKLKKGRPTLVEKPNITKVDYDNMETLIENGNEPSKNYILNEEEVEVDKWALRVKSKRNSKGGKKKSRRKRSRRKGKRSINKRKIKQSRNKKQSKKRY